MDIIEVVNRDSLQENISNFLKACRSLGMVEHDCFETIDLFEQKDMGVVRFRGEFMRDDNDLNDTFHLYMQVVICIHALGRMALTVQSFRGPHLRSTRATDNVTAFAIF